MSYILDALRRADLERERGGVPGLHAQGLPPLTGEEPAAPRVSTWVWAAAVVGALLTGGLVWVLAQPEPPTAAPRVSASPAAQPSVRDQVPAMAQAPSVVTSQAPSVVTSQAPSVVTSQAPSVGPTQLPSRPALAAAPVPVLSPAPLPAPIAPLQPTTSTADKAALDLPREAAAASGPTPAATPRPSSPARNAASDSAPATPRIHALHELPEEVRRTIPALVVNGSVYSKNPADRFLIVNGQIVHESESVGPNIVLEQIGQRGAVLSTHGHRFEISY